MKGSFLRVVTVRNSLDVLTMEKVVLSSMNLPVEKEPFGIQRVMLAITIGQCKGKIVEYGEMKMEQAAFLTKTATRKQHHQLQWTIKNQPTHREKAPLQRHSSLRHLQRHHQAAVLPPSLNYHPVAAVLLHHHLPLPPPPQVAVVQHLQQVVVLEVTNSQPRRQAIQVRLPRHLGQALHQTKVMN